MACVDMDNLSFILRSLGQSPINLQEGMIKQILSDVAFKIQQSPANFDDQKLIQLATVLVPYICDPTFSTLWLALLHKLSNIQENEKLNAVYNEINKKQAEIFPSSSLPVEVLHCLWLSHLPSLEFFVLFLVKKITDTILFPNSMISILSNICIIDVASKEPLIYQMIYIILHSILVQRNYQANIIELLALFSHRVKLLTLNRQVSVQRPPYIASVKSIFFCSPESSSPKIVGKTLVQLHKAFNLCRNEHLKYFGSEDGSDIVDEEFWSLTVEYRHWILAALNGIYHCDIQDIPSCLWLLLMHKRIKPNMSEYTDVQEKLFKYISYLRTIFDNSLVSAEHIQVFKSRSDSFFRTEFFQCKPTALQLILQILIVFFFQSSSGFKFGQEFITGQHNFIVEDFIIRLIQYYQLMSLQPSVWDSHRKSSFRTFIDNLLSWSHANHSNRDLHNELSFLLASLNLQ